MSNAKLKYQQAMERLYLACIVLSGTALVVITLIIPLGVFMRYVMHKPLQWPEPAAVIMMVFGYRSVALRLYDQAPSSYCDARQASSTIFQ